MSASAAIIAILLSVAAVIADGGALRVIAILLLIAMLLASAVATGGRRMTANSRLDGGRLAAGANVAQIVLAVGALLLLVIGLVA